MRRLITIIAPVLLYVLLLTVPAAYAIGFQVGVDNGASVYKSIMQERFIEIMKDEIVRCESGGVHSRDNPSGASGIAQFKRKTFNWMKKIAGMPDLKWKNEEDQLTLLEWALRNGYGGHWECYPSALERYGTIVMSEVVNAG